MMHQYSDIEGRCACFADAATGIVEHKYKGVQTKTRIPVGGDYSIERENTVTILKRVNDKEFAVTRSYKTK